jgi:hypothetical protein
MTPTARTMQYLRRWGYLVDVVERWIPRANVRRDLFGIGDLLAVTMDEPPLLVQCTSLANVSARVAKAQTCQGLAVWLRTGSRFQVFGWAKGRGGLWHPKIVELKGADMAPDVLSRPPPRSRSRYRQGADLFAGIVAGTVGPDGFR